MELLADEDRPGGWLLLLDRIRQSYVDLNDPTYLEFPYLQAFAEAVEAMRPGPLTIVHIGGGGATFARWCAAVRPGSEQIVFEPNARLLELVRRRLPITEVDFVVRGGRSGVAAAAAASADVVVVDAFSGGRVPAELASREFFDEAARVLRPGGLLLMNTTDGPRLAYVRRLVAAMAGRFGEVAIERENLSSVGNVVLFAARSGDLPMAVALAEAGPQGPIRALASDALAEFIGDAEPFTDADSQRSPSPPENTWRVGGDL